MEIDGRSGYKWPFKISYPTSQPCFCAQPTPGCTERWHPLPLQFRNRNSQPPSYVWWCQSNDFSFHLLREKNHLHDHLYSAVIYICVFSFSLCVLGAVPGEWNHSLSTLLLSSVWKTPNQSTQIYVLERTAMQCTKLALCSLSVYVKTNSITIFCKQMLYYE